MAPSYTPSSAQVRSSFASLMKSFPELRKAFFDEYKLFPSLYDKFLVVEDSKKQIERENVIGGRPVWGTKTEANEYTFGHYAQGTEITYTHLTYADAYDLSEELMEDNQWKYVMRTAKEMARGGYAAVETLAANVLNNGFVGGSTGSNGSQLFSASQTLINSVSTGSNAITTALSADGLRSAYILADRMLNEAAIYVPVDFDTLVVPPELRQAAEELAKSMYTPLTGNNAINVYKNRIKQIVVNPYLTSSTAWFLMASSLDKRGKFFWRVKPMFYDDRDPYSGNYLMKARERMIAGHTEWQGAIGSTGVA